jgi:hypothetical protein
LAKGEKIHDTPIPCNPLRQSDFVTEKRLKFRSLRRKPRGSCELIVSILRGKAWSSGV